MSLANNKTRQLFQTFMPRRNEIFNLVSRKVFDIQIYPTGYYDGFVPAEEFVKWAAMEVPEYSELPEGMETFDLAGGNYAVFHRTGSLFDTSIFQYIFNKWLPASEHTLADRPHFQLLDEHSRLTPQNIEEEIWVPVD